MIIAIDGPSGAGKSSVAKACAKTLGFSCLDTGAMYRCIAWLALQKDIPLDDDAALGELARACDIRFGHSDGDPIPKTVFVDDNDVTSAIRTSQIDKAVSPVSAAPSVREAMVHLQRKVGLSGNFVVEGRDIGTVVFPDAQLKIFLTASPEERAHRRVRQNADRGVGSIDYEEVLRDIIRRDEYDSNRAESPLCPATDAHIIDSTEDYIEDIIAKICSMAHACIQKTAEEV
ncbi:(d)CMP kinase [Adlercreutzia sp. ZJ304]|uniref:(d)CMP kinase n=1 Tax=Adlercreutzia sp. ZJ304 TaxID=2709791 RepID=UPI0013EB6817|nr:(d)CMP kinase [Adlercreutzia sp. ZJ304]